MKTLKRKEPLGKKSVYAWGILNQFGDPWTTETFATPGDAERYMELFWGNIKNPPDMSKHEIVPVILAFPATPQKHKASKK